MILACGGRGARLLFQPVTVPFASHAGSRTVRPSVRGPFAGSWVDDYYQYRMQGPDSSREWVTEVKQRLGTPAYERGGIVIYRGDCLKLMRELSAPAFDLAVTSPPYNIGKEYEQERCQTDYLVWSEQWLREVARLVRLDGSFWLNLGYSPCSKRGKAVPLAYLLWNKVPMFLMQEIVWHYGAGVAARKSFSPRNEKFLWYVRNPDNYVFNLDAVRDPNVKYPKQKKNGRLKCNPLGKNPSDVWQFAKVTSGRDRSSPERTPHPAQFPLRVIDRIVKACSNRGNLVFDPFLGSGTTAVAAARNGRDALGFEIRGDYIDIAVKRVEREFARQSSQLFASVGNS